jgi:ATP-dependent exoDNAse (exonuclease V) beta subunit
VHRFDQQTAEAEWIASEIERIHLVDGVPLGRIGVLVRSKRRFLPEMSRSLERRRIAHDPPESRLAEQPAVRFVLDATAVAAGADVPSELDRAVRRILLGPLFRVSLGRLRDIERARAVDEIPWSQAIRALVPEGDALADLLDEPRWAAEWPVRRGFWHLWSSLPQIAELVSGTGRRRELRSWSSLAQVIDRWGERNPSVTLVDYRTLLDQEEFEARPLLSYTRPDEDRVTLTTLHQAKGLEFDVVFIADAVEGVFPDLRRRDSLLGVRHILRHDDLDTAGYLRFRLQEERRLAYTAMTRATKRVVWTATASGAEEGRGMPSRFLPLVAGAESLDGAITPVDTEARPVSRREAESHLRRILTDPARSAPERMAAASALANGPRWGLRETSTFHGVRRRGDDGGLVDAATLRLSPSQAESYERCPRRYALERRLKIGDATSIYAEFGTLVHDVLEAAEHAAFERGEPRSSLDEALGLLADRFDHATFGGPPFSHAWHARGVDLLRRLYDVWPEGGHVVALERELHLRIADVPWVGYADRIEETSGRIKIVDYKTTRNPPTLEQAARSIQLGFYLAAAAADPDVTSHGTPVAAEMWYPAKESRSLTTRSFDTARAGDVMATMVAITEGIRDERFDPVVSEECDRCPVRQVCPKWPQGGEDFS